ncbi:50S ribosomal protein L9 [bacterium B13(2017)]|nr:50S ribosomal protein L9 [bacterium B13(2017)]
MEVILEKTIPKLGLIGAIVKVADGYARNFLLPKKLAIMATKHNVAMVEKRIKAIRAKELQEQQAFQSLAEKLEGVSVNIEVKASEDGKLFGSVSNKEIAESLKEKGFDIDKKSIDLEEHIKYLGVYTIALKLHHLVQTEIKVWVIRESDS